MDGTNGKVGDCDVTNTDQTLVELSESIVYIDF